MNQQKLQYMAHHISEVSDTDIAELKQLIASYPFYALPHAVLAKIYFEREHYMFENALTQAAMRVKDREWLYHYIHTGEEIAVEQFETGVVINDFETPDAIPEINVEEEEKIGENNEEVTDIEIEAALINDVNAFLGETDNAEVVTIPEVTNPEPEAVELIVSTDTESEEIEITGAPEVEISPIEEPENELETEIPVAAEEDIMEEAPAVEEEAEVVAVSEPVAVPDINLRKHPVYNVETFLDSEHKEEAQTVETPNDSKDFFYWLSHPVPESKEEYTETSEEKVAEEDNVTGNDRMSIIDQFIKSNPSITRPKREFYNAENMAKRSELVALDFVSETLANIYYEQGNIDLAVQAYEKLSLQNPLKHAYFASLIEKIKKEKR